MIISFVASTDLGMQFPHVAPADPLPDMIDNVNRQTNGRTDAHENKKCPAGLVTGKLLDACKKHGCYGEQSEAKNLQTSHGSGCSNYNASLRRLNEISTGTCEKNLHCRNFCAGMEV